MIKPMELTASKKKSQLYSIIHNIFEKQIFIEIFSTIIKGQINLNYIILFVHTITKFN